MKKTLNITLSVDVETAEDMSEVNIINNLEYSFEGNDVVKVIPGSIYIQDYFEV